MKPVKHARHGIYKACNISRLYAESVLRLLGITTPGALWQGFDEPKREAPNRITYRHYFEDANSFWEQTYVDVTLIADKESKWGYKLLNATSDYQKDDRLFLPVATGIETFQVKTGSYHLEEAWHQFLATLTNWTADPRFKGFKLVKSTRTPLPFEIYFMTPNGDLENKTSDIVDTAPFIELWSLTRRVVVDLEKVYVVPRNSTTLIPGIHAHGTTVSLQFQTSRA